MAALLPAAFSALDALGLFATGLGMFSFAQHNFIDNKTPGTTLRFQVGLNGAGPRGQPLSGADGQAPAVHLYNDLGDWLGSSKNSRVYCPSGETCDVRVGGALQQVPYTVFEANDDGVCLAYITVSWHDGTQYAWTGNYARYCNHPWYYSDIYVKNNKVPDDGTIDSKLACGWMDGNGDSKTRGMQVYWPAFGAGFSEHGGHKDFYCTTPWVLNFREDVSPQSVLTRSYYEDMNSKRSVLPAGETPANASAPATPENEPRSNRMALDTRLIKSKSKAHTASGLCESESSMGPTLVSYAERKVCHMQYKTLYSFCEDVKTGECWDDVKHAIVHKGAKGVVKRAANPAVKFEKVIHWG
ncbi:hypothetical protein E4U42_003531 [Claviceps africana]|uniref:Uncharacterized protein n=1 Tax=Claviceps africana TaxID=83212 RepID=A0A8K0NGR8_9HYPO|nr:hypothetical protein E4U42_003531 [Claviceps africana]